MSDTPITQSHQPVDLERHSRKCAICHSEDREAIESAFLNWLSPHYITLQFRDIRDRMSLYHHAWATGLYEYRRRNLRSALDRLLENAEGARVSGDCVIRAIRAYSRLHEEGRWTEPVQKVVISRRHADLTLPAEDQTADLHKLILIDTPKRLETTVTPTKQSVESFYNRDKSATSQEPL